MKLNVVQTTMYNNEIEIFIEKHGSVFHSWDFLKCVGVQPCWITAGTGSELVGVLPLVKTKKHGLQSYHVPPYCYIFGPVVSGDYSGSYSEIVSTMLASLPQAPHYDFKLWLGENDLIPFLKEGFSISARQSHIVPADAEYNMHSIHNSKRRYLKKLLKLIEEDEIYFKEGRSALDDVFDLQLITAENSNFNAHRSSLLNIVKDGQAGFEYECLVLYKKDGTPIAGAFCPMDRFSAYHLINASTSQEDKLLDKANILVIYEMVRRINQRGLKFDFEGSSIPGIANFYRLMGGLPVINFRLQKTKSKWYRMLKTAEFYFKH